MNAETWRHISLDYEWNDIPFLLEWNDHFSRNGMSTSFLQEWSSCIPFLFEWNDRSIPAGMECMHSIIAGME